MRWLGWRRELPVAFALTVLVGGASLVWQCGTQPPAVELRCPCPPELGEDD